MRVRSEATWAAGTDDPGKQIAALLVVLADRLGGDVTVNLGAANNRTLILDGDDVRAMRVISWPSEERLPLDHRNRCTLPEPPDPLSAVRKLVAICREQVPVDLVLIERADAELRRLRPGGAP